ncbi:ribonucleoside-diphosphate reductase large subunit isoform X2 [Vitis vinifera]|uniref:ribonucleoside-diphosphate reductase large subunit isoform X2 n=1 Tax=Vitis vinifera TaxID=29760 RepID=UPI00053FA657|nr:ribonucleoside-diphosphate reductase large subunit isoform X2 [Vitis vinifera]|eukprot:XP_010652894.1 PREDICTED: ribonucleoside-diphosphate reductase large subunit-like isoform X2 [Vitis vinifera]
MAEVYEHVTTSHLDELATAMTANHPNCASVRFFFFPDYVSFFFFLAERIVVSNLHKNTKKSFSETIKDMHNHFNERSGLKNPWIAADVYKIIMKAQQLNKDIFETICHHALKDSGELAVKEGSSEIYDGCPVSEYGMMC